MELIHFWESHFCNYKFQLNLTNQSIQWAYVVINQSTEKSWPKKKKPVWLPKIDSQICRLTCIGYQKCCWLKPNAHFLSQSAFSSILFCPSVIWQVHLFFHCCFHLFSPCFSFLEGLILSLRGFHNYMQLIKVNVLLILKTSGVILSLGFSWRYVQWYNKTVSLAKKCSLSKMRGNWREEGRLLLIYKEYVP